MKIFQKCSIFVYPLPHQFQLFGFAFCIALAERARGGAGAAPRGRHLCAVQRGRRRAEPEEEIASRREIFASRGDVGAAPSEVGVWQREIGAAREQVCAGPIKLGVASKEFGARMAGAGQKKFGTEPREVRAPSPPRSEISY